MIMSAPLVGKSFRSSNADVTGEVMTATRLRKEIKKQVDDLPEGDLPLAKGLLDISHRADA